MRAVDEPYSEQVVLLPGQGLWYSAPVVPHHFLNEAEVIEGIQPRRVFTRGQFGLIDDWFVYMCPQSVFKIHPLFDAILAEILKRQPRGHLVVTSGRRSQWTQAYVKRLEVAIGAETFRKRVHVIDRVSSEQFVDLLKIADLLLQPFPYDGSRTSADSLAAGVPYLTLPTEYLRGRMGLAFLRTMNLPQLVARNSEDYVSIAVDLANDPHTYGAIKIAVEERAHLIWEDFDTVHGWVQFLSVACGLPAPDRDLFMTQCLSEKDRAKESLRRYQRRGNRKQFDARRGTERWLLQEGVALLQDGSQLEEGEIPRVFNRWRPAAIRNHSYSHAQVNQVLSTGDEQTIGQISEINTKDESVVVEVDINAGGDFMPPRSM